MKKEFYGSLLLLVIFITCTALYHGAPQTSMHNAFKSDSAHVAGSANYCEEKSVNTCVK